MKLKSLKSRHTFLFAVAIAIAVLFNWLIVNSGAVSAAGFAVSPSSLELTVEKGTQTQGQLRIYNTGEENVEFAAASSSPTAVKVSPEKGFIEVRGAAAVTITATGTKAGESEEEVVISFSSHKTDSPQEVSLELGTAVPVRLNVLKRAEAAANALIGAFLSASIVFVGLTTYYFARYVTRKKAEKLTDFQSAYDLYLLRK